MKKKELCVGLDEAARKGLTGGDCKTAAFVQRIGEPGVEAGELAAIDRRKPQIRRAWIPGVEIFARTIHSQPHRGIFAELVRRDEGILAKIGLWPKQWSAAQMFAHSAKGFHVHPPSVPPETTAEKSHRRLFIAPSRNYALRRYDEEQWDVIFFVQGRAEVILRDLRAGLPSRIFRLFIDSDNHPSRNNVAIVVPPVVAHAIRTEDSEHVIMVYGTSTTFHTNF